MALDLGLHLGLGLGSSASPTDVVLQDAVGWWEAEDASAVGNGGAVVTVAGRGGTPTLTASGGTTYNTAGGLHWFGFDGSNDNLSVNDATLRVVGDLTLVCGAYKTAGGSYGGILTCQTGAGTVNAYEWRYQNAGGDTLAEFVAADGAAAETDAPGALLGAFATAEVISLRRDVGVDVEFSLNGAREVEVHTTVPTANASSVFVMGNRNAGGIPLGGRIYCALVFDRRLSDVELALAEAYVASKCGVTL